MASFPASIWAGNTRGTNLSDAQTHTTWHDNVMAEVIATETELGTNARLDKTNVKSAIAASGRTVFIFNAPAVNTDATTTGTLTTWITVDTVTVPSWTTSAIIHLDICNAGAITAAALYTVEATLAGGSYVGDRGVANFQAAGDNMDISFTTSVTAPATGVRTVLLGARRASGTGQMRAGPTTKISGWVLFQG